MFGYTVKCCDSNKTISFVHINMLESTLICLYLFKSWGCATLWTPCILYNCQLYNYALQVTVFLSKKNISSLSVTVLQIYWQNSPINNTYPQEGVTKKLRFGIWMSNFGDINIDSLDLFIQVKNIIS